MEIIVTNSIRLIRQQNNQTKEIKVFPLNGLNLALKPKTYTTDKKYQLKRQLQKQTNAVQNN